MEAFPHEYVEHDLPLVFLSGLGQPASDSACSSTTSAGESGTRIHLASPECSSERAQSLRESFLETDGSRRSWNASSLPGPIGKLPYKMKVMGTVGTKKRICSGNG